MTQTKRSRPGGYSEAAPMVKAATNSDSTRERRQLPDARAVAYLPAGGRARLLLIVDPCPYCGQAHQHFAWTVGAAMTGIRAGCGKPYRLSLAAVDLRGGGRQ